MDIVISKNNIPIKLTAERWRHITMGHPEMANYYHEILTTIENPFEMYEGSNLALMAISNKVDEGFVFIVEVYKEKGLEGFVITSYLTKYQEKFINKKLVWKQ